MTYNAETDRRSAVSSFYGGRKSSFDALNAELAPKPASQRVRNDSSSSFFNPDGAERARADMLTPSAGYNRMSFFDAGREEPVKGGRDEEEDVGMGSPRNEAWDVYADFNNAGPKYSSAFGKPDAGYHQLPPEMPPTPSIKHEIESNAGAPVEMVTVPALGAEWKRSELQAMTKAGRKERHGDDRITKWRQWNRGQRGIWGKWGTRKQVVITLFVTLCIIGLTLAFTVPRIPGFAFNGQSPLAFSKRPPSPSFSRAPANFTFNADLLLQIDSGANYIPIKINSMSAQVYDLDTTRLVGTGEIKGKTIPAKTFTDIAFPLNFTYVASNDTDKTWANWYNACRNVAFYTDGKRPGVDFRIILSMKIAGLIGTRFASTQISNVGCPFQLAQNSA